MKTIADAIKSINSNAKVNVYQPTLDSNVSEANIDWLENTTIINNDDIQAKLDELRTAEANEIQAKETLKASAKAKLIAGEALTEEEANTIIL